jgi:hypothetical protein
MLHPPRKTGTSEVAASETFTETRGMSLSGRGCVKTNSGF